MKAHNIGNNWIIESHIQNTSDISCWVYCHFKNFIESLCDSNLRVHSKKTNFHKIDQPRCFEDNSQLLIRF